MSDPFGVNHDFAIALIVSSLGLGAWRNPSMIAREARREMEGYESGEVIDDKYRLIRKLGEGAMGEVWAALHILLNRQVALKVLLPHYASDRHMMERFIGEARASASIGSEHIIEVTDAGILEDESPYLVMELLDGLDLRQLLQREGRFTTARACFFAVQACAGLAAAHENAIVHRDLKPANLFITRRPDGTERVRVLDFGVAKFLLPGEEGDLVMTAAGTTLGTPLYMAPEQFGNAGSVDHRADVYSMGAILYEMLTGRRPHQAGSMLEMLAKVSMEDPLPPRSIVPDLDAELEGVLKLSMIRNPDHRLQSALQLLHALEPYASEYAGPVALEASVGRYSSAVGTYPAGAAVSRHGGSISSASFPAVDSAIAASMSQSGALPAVAPDSNGDVAGGRTRKLLWLVIVVLASAFVGTLVVAAVIAFGPTFATTAERPALEEPVSPPPTAEAIPTAPTTGAALDHFVPEFAPSPHDRMISLEAFDATGAPSLGPVDAPVVIYMFTDFQCPPCQRGHAAAVQAWQRHQQEVRLVMLHFPMDMACNPSIPVPYHAAACHAASVAICAGEQGRFWEVSEPLHHGAATLDRGIVDGIAGNAGLDVARLHQCLASERPRQQIEHDVGQALNLQINVTPVLIVNGRLTLGNPGARLEAMIHLLLDNGGRWN